LIFVEFYYPFRVTFYDGKQQKSRFREADFARSTSCAHPIHSKEVDGFDGIQLNKILNNQLQPSYSQPFSSSAMV
jgi:hypothetical protein